MKAMDQKSAEQLEAFLDGTLTGRERADAEQLARNSEAARDYLVYLKGLKLTASLAEIEKAPIDLTHKVMYRIMAPRQSSSWSWGWAHSALAGAACLLVGLFFGSIMTAPGTAPNSGSASTVRTAEMTGGSAKEDLSSMLSALNREDIQNAKAWLKTAESKGDFAQLKEKGLNLVVVHELLDQGDTLSLAEYLEKFTGKLPKKIRL